MPARYYGIKETEAKFTHSSTCSCERCVETPSAIETLKKMAKKAKAGTPDDYYKDQIYSQYHPKADKFGYVHGVQEYENGLPSKITLHIEREYEAFGRSGIGQFVVNGYKMIDGKKESIDGTSKDEPVLQLLAEIKPYKKGKQTEKPQKIEPIDNIVYSTQSDIQIMDRMIDKLNELISYINKQNEKQD